MHLFKKIIVGILTLESRLIIRKYKPFIVAVTGSVGKTSTKDAIYSVLKDERKYVRKSEKSLNSDIGLPLTIIGVPNAWRNISGWIRNMIQGFELILWRKEYPDCLIVEIGADHPGDIKNVVKWLHPDIAVITRVSRTPVHVEFFTSPQQVFEEKAALAEAVKTGGTLVLFADDENTLSMAERIAKEKNVTISTYGMNPAANVKGQSQTIMYEESAPVGFTFNIEMDGNIFPVSMKGILGSTYHYPLLAAAAVGKACGMTVEKIAAALPAYKAPCGRMNIIQGLNGSTLIDDTYNSSPDAVIAALETLKAISCSGTKIAVFGDMMELGKYATEEHRRIGREVIGIAGQLILVGQRSRMTMDEALKNGFPSGSVHDFDMSAEAAAYLIPLIKAGDVVLVKGSQSICMERVVKALMRQPDLAKDLLVRQEREWLEKK